MATPLNRLDFATELYRELADQQYSPSRPREYIVSDKYNLVARIVPIFSIKDYCVYYYCVKTIEDYLVEKRVPDTYGGFRMGGAHRREELSNFNEIGEIFASVSEFSFDFLGWVKVWREYQQKAYVYSREADYSYFIEFDIANFYDSIELAMLEKMLKHAVPVEFSDELDILSIFLKYWDKEYYRFSARSVGLPQDQAASCSRVLANFFLHKYDNEMREYALSHYSRYIRFTDDQIIMTHDRETAENILVFASKTLKKYGLNINAAKVRPFSSRMSFDQYWAFDIFRLLEDKNDIGNIEKAVALYQQRKGKEFRSSSVLKRLINCGINNIDFSLKTQIFADIFNDDFLSTCSGRDMYQMYLLLNSSSARSDYINKLSSLSRKVLFNQFHYNILTAGRLGIPLTDQDIKEINDRIIELNILL